MTAVQKPKEPFLNSATLPRQPGSYTAQNPRKMHCMCGKQASKMSKNDQRGPERSEKGVLPYHGVAR
jgi:hypothetical protein